MGQIIASTYEIQEQIGAGGGGIVYLARHMRLGKSVVLKADKRTLAAKPEVLRREVDALKNLSHTYIPQVYDFVEENGTVYTVMDYIEGQSFDKLLRPGFRFEQTRVVEWACQLLEALVYLHSRPPYGILHSDIKPANIMLTPQGTICLIDFNIALALGEEGAVRVGYSFGYASPEHYGLDYSDSGQHSHSTATAKTELLSEIETQAMKTGSIPLRRERMILLDVRSDIYSLGATLYHLFSGERPPKDAREVQPISEALCSRGVIDIIAKAMAPDPNDRYQTAAEMLYAFEHLHETDERTLRLKRRGKIAAAALSLLFLSGGLLGAVGLKQMEQLQNAYVLAEYAQNALRDGDVDGAIQLALEALPERQGLFDIPHTAQAQKALTDALGVYDLTDDFQPYKRLELPSAPLKTAISPSGRWLAVFYAYEVAVFDTETGEQTVTLPMLESALADVAFCGEARLLYAGVDGLTACDLESGVAAWSGEAASALSVSADGSRVAAVYKDAGECMIYDAQSGTLLSTLSFGERTQRVPGNDRFADPEDALFVLNGDGTWLAVSFSDGALYLYDLREEGRCLELFDASEYTHFEGGFYGNCFAVAASGAAEPLFTVIDVERVEQLGAFSGGDPYHVWTDESGIYLAQGRVLVRLDPESGEQTEIAYPPEAVAGFAHTDTYSLVTTTDGCCYLFDRGAALVGQLESDFTGHFVWLAGELAGIANRDENVVRLLRLSTHTDTELFSYDPSYAHDEARVSADGETVMLFRYDAFRLYRMDGTLLAEAALPDAAQVYDQQFCRDADGSRLEVTYYSGLIRAYSAEDGSLLWERSGDAPDETLYEEFLTDRWRVTSPLHGTPAVYDRTSGKLFCELESDAYLTYVTQAGDYLITEYSSSEGERYGLLLNEQWETLAELPNLCDIVSGQLIFDDPSGVLRVSPIYSLEELRTCAEGYAVGGRGGGAME